jgi:23S rRNA (guanine745-N1)-methyltransferase
VLDDALPFLVCPLDAGALHREGGALGCAQGHRFDVTRQGAVTLLPGHRKAEGDSAAMVAARVAFLDAGHFAPLSAALAEEAAAHAGAEGCIADVGAGTGHHLAAVLGRLPGRVGIALDASPAALRHAARSGVAAVGCDTWRGLPLRDGAAALVLDVFAPRNGAELARVLARDGAVLVATPAAGHLAELVAALDLLQVDQAKDRRLEGTLAPHLHQVAASDCTFPLALSHDAAAHLAAMGPSARHRDPADLRAAVARLPEPVPVTVAVRLTVWRRSF